MLKLGTPASAAEASTLPKGGLGKSLPYLIYAPREKLVSLGNFPNGNIEAYLGRKEPAEGEAGGSLTLGG